MYTNEIFNNLSFILIQLIAVILVNSNGLNRKIAISLTFMNLGYYFYQLLMVNTYYLYDMLFLSFELLAHVRLFFLMTIIFLLFMLIKRRYQNVVQWAFLPFLSVWTVGALRIDVLYISFILTFVIMTISLSASKKEEMVKSGISYYMTSFFILNIFLVSVGLFFMATGSLYLTNINLLSEDIFLLFLLSFICVGLYWISSFPFNSWPMNISKTGGVNFLAMIILGVVFPLGFKFMILINELLPLLSNTDCELIKNILLITCVVSAAICGIMAISARETTELVSLLVSSKMSLTLIYFTYDGISISGFNHLLLNTMTLLTLVSLLILISIIARERQNITVIEWRQQSHNSPIMMLLSIFTIAIIAGLPFGGIFYSRVIYLKDLLQNGDPNIALAITIAYLILFVAVIMGLLSIKNYPASKRGNNISLSRPSFIEVSFSVIFIIVPILLAPWPDLIYF